jgi:quercetin dioxygenase-like cupin family protein
MKTSVLRKKDEVVHLAQTRLESGEIGSLAKRGSIGAKMNCVRRFAVTALLLAGIALSAAGQDKAGVTTAAGSKFGNLPGLPTCATLSVQRGDPTKGPAVILAKATAGCKVPWHWHTAAENLMIVAGKAKVEMKDAAATAAAPGDYVYMPGKHPHQFTCTSACTFFIATEGAFDIHYVDKDGKEIPPDQALKPAAKPAATKK